MPIEFNKVCKHESKNSRSASLQGKSCSGFTVVTIVTHTVGGRNPSLAAMVNLPLLTRASLHPRRLAVLLPSTFATLYFSSFPNALVH